MIVVFISNEGRLANKLWMAVKLFVVNLEYNVNVTYPSFDEYSDYFLSTGTKGFNLSDMEMAGKVRLISWVSKLLCRFYRHTPSYKRNVSKLVFIDNICHRNTKSIEVVNGWLKFVDENLFKKYKKDILNFFQPCEKYTSNSNRVIDSARIKSDIVIGVHIRRTDYSEWEKGMYYFPDDHYHHYMNQLLRIFPEKNVCFVICSDEPVNIFNFKSFDTVLASNHFIEDLYTLSLCDYIIGPPSTYSAWASFFGEVPLYHIGQQKNPITISDFKAIHT